MKLSMKELTLKVLAKLASHTSTLSSLTATYSNGTLKMGNLRIYRGQVTVASTGQGTITFPSGTFSQALWAFPFCAQGGFGAYDTISITSLTASAVKVYQYNSANASMQVGVLVIGLS